MSTYYTTEKTVKILTGQSQSQVVDLDGFVAFAVILPAAFDGTTLTFLTGTSPDGAGFAPVYDDAGVEVAVTVAAGRAVAIDVAAGKLAALRYVKIRSGTSGAPQTQSAERVLTVTAKR